MPDETPPQAEPSRQEDRFLGYLQVPLAPEVEGMLEVYQTFRDYAKHEDTLVNNRMTWMLTIHGFLYATYGFTLQKKVEVLEKARHALNAAPSWRDLWDHVLTGNAFTVSLIHMDFFLCLICVVGLGITWSAWRSISAAERASDNLRFVFEHQFPIFKIRRNDGFMELRDGFEPSPRWRERMKDRKNYIEKVAALGSLYIPTIGGGGSQSTVRRGASAPRIITYFLVGSWTLAIAFTAYGAMFRAASTQSNIY